jgi:opacity protein-like surface antigen
MSDAKVARRIAAVRNGGWLVAVALLVSAPAARAETYLTPFVGAAFSGDSDDSRLTYGGALGWAGEGGVLGFELEFAHTPDFFGTTALGNNNVSTLMGNLMLLSPGRTRIYGSGGIGLLRTRVEDVSGFFEIDSNNFGLNVGGGVLLFPGESVGLRGDVRYFRNLTDPEPDDEFDIDLGGLDYWRATGGVVLKF